MFTSFKYMYAYDSGSALMARCQLQAYYGHARDYVRYINQQCADPDETQQTTVASNKHQNVLQFPISIYIPTDKSHSSNPSFSSKYSIARLHSTSLDVLVTCHVLAGKPSYLQACFKHLTRGWFILYITNPAAGNFCPCSQ